MLVEVENAKSLTYYAAWAIDEKQADAPLAVSMAKSYASDASRKVSNAGIQLHGGIGMTWEHDLHLYMKRAKASEVAFRRRDLAPRAGGVVDRGVMLRLVPPSLDRDIAGYAAALEAGWSPDTRAIVSARTARAAIAEIRRC
jgi:hypothetical protein